MRKLQPAEKYIALKQRWNIANKTEANITLHISIALNVFPHVMKLRSFLGLLINLPLCFRFGEQNVRVCCNATHLLYVNVTFCHLSLEDFIHLFKEVFYANAMHCITPSKANRLKMKNCIYTVY